MWIIVIKTVVQENSPNSYELAPAGELKNPQLAVLLEGQVSEVFERQKSPQVLGKNCQGIGGALVEVWYAGGNPGNTEGIHFEMPDNYFSPSSTLHISGQ